MRYETYIRKYEEMRDANTPKPHKRKIAAELRRVVKQAIQKWLLEQGHLGNASSFQEWHAGWHSVNYSITLHPNAAVEVQLNSEDFSFGMGSVTTPTSRFRVAKKALFS